MKKILFSLLLLFVFTLSACDNTVETHTVSFIVEGTIVSTETVLDGSTISEPNQPVVDGKEFGGWFSDSTFNVPYDFSSTVEGEYTLYAKFSLSIYSLTITTEDGSETVDVQYGSDISDPIGLFDSTYSEFLVLYLDAAFATLYEYDSMPSENLTLYGRDEEPTYTITFQSTEGTELFSGITLNAEDEIPDLPVPTLEGLEFLGWVDGEGSPFALEYMPEEDITLYVTWKSRTIKLGVMGPLSNEYALYGLSVLYGAQMAVDEINANGGVFGMDLELFEHDSKGSAVEGVWGYNRLTDDVGIDALIGGTFSGVTLAVKELAINDGLPMITPTASHPDVTLDADNVFRACYTDVYQGTAAAAFVAEELEATNVAIMYNRDDAYSEGLAQAFINELGSRSIMYTELEFGASDSDYTAQLTTIKNGGYDVVFLPTYVFEAGNILTQANTLGLSMPFVGGDGWDGLEEDYATVAEGHYFIMHFSENDDDFFVQDFISNYETEYGETPNALAALAYDAVYAMVEAIEDANSLESEDIVAALSVVTLTDSVTGLLSFDEQGNAYKEVTIVQIVSGENVVVVKKDIG